MHVESLGRAVPVRVPHLVEDLLPVDNRTRILGEQREQVELLRAQRNLDATHVHPARPAVDLERAELLRPGRRLGHRAPADRAYAGQQLAEAERLHDVVVGSELEADHALRLLRPRRDDDDRDG